MQTFAAFLATVDDYPFCQSAAYNHALRVFTRDFPLPPRAIFTLCLPYFPQFLVRKVAMLAKKEKSTTTQASGRPFFNPFLPPDPNMFVCDISPTHVCLLNKFNVVDYHILACTKVCGLPRECD